MQSGLIFSRLQIPCIPPCANLVSLESGSGFEIRPLETLRVFLPCRATNLGACCPFFSRHNLGFAPQFASPENDPLAQPPSPQFRSCTPCATRLWCLHPCPFRHFHAIGRCRDLFHRFVSFVFFPRIFFLPHVRALDASGSRWCPI